MIGLDIDDDAPERAMSPAEGRTRTETADPALDFYVERQERATRIGLHLERARTWGAVEDAEHLHDAGKRNR
ncbi:type II toxin-antitoxin system VapB family antitoxin [Streptomyces sp. DH37]|uniref:type II toxin-antitoxin system VapB family antitoxin n=1 Tax=Streptomyces sp. DH37 TaxID=3040122 RepID=UPI0024414641|nr:type II toxin-antitoxin system VapB family antitoxin [Streptomyces sp. DH37]MDG9704922.1 type II toxin-antitoxin system VapB family antitoxin [Streptomyces sp. DH37]